MNNDATMGETNLEKGIIISYRKMKLDKREADDLSHDDESKYESLMRHKKYVCEDLEIKMNLNPVQEKINKGIYKFNRALSRLGMTPKLDLYDRAIVNNLEDTISIYHDEVRLNLVPPEKILMGWDKYDPLKITASKSRKKSSSKPDNRKDLNYTVDKIIFDMNEALTNYDNLSRNIDSDSKAIKSSPNPIISERLEINKETCKYLLFTCQQLYDALPEIKKEVLKKNAAIEDNRGYFARKIPFINPSDVNSPIDRITYKWEKFAERIINTIDSVYTKTKSA